MSTHASQPVSHVLSWLGETTFERAATVTVWVVTIVYTVGALAHWWPVGVLGELTNALISTITSFYTGPVRMP